MTVIGDRLPPEPAAVETLLVPEPPAVEPLLVPEPPAVEPLLVPEPPSVEPLLVPEPPAVEPLLVPEPLGVGTPLRTPAPALRGLEELRGCWADPIARGASPEAACRATRP